MMIAPFGRRMQCHQVSKHDLLPCFWKCYRVFFLVVRHMMMYDGQIVIFFVFFFFSLYKVHDCPFCFCIFSLSHRFWISYLVLTRFIKVLFVFNLVLQLQFLIYIFSFMSLFFQFLIYFLGLLVKVLLAFNFIIQRKFFIFYFSIPMLVILIFYFVLIFFIIILHVFTLIF